MKILVCGLSILILFSAAITFVTVAQGQNPTTAFDIDAQISDLAYDLADIHMKQAEEEMAKVPPNRTGADIHFNLAGMTADQISSMVEGVTLTEENKQKLMQVGPENCIITSDAEVGCLH
jgi:hypothetical protein